jgi:hypothetical protein
MSIWYGMRCSFVITDHLGSIVGLIGESGPKILLAGHMDEVALMVSHIPKKTPISRHLFLAQFTDRSTRGGDQTTLHIASSAPKRKSPQLCRRMKDLCGGEKSGKRLKNESRKPAKCNESVQTGMQRCEKATRQEIACLVYCTSSPRGICTPHFARILTQGFRYPNMRKN